MNCIDSAHKNMKELNKSSFKNSVTTMTPILKIERKKCEHVRIFHKIRQKKSHILLFMTVLLQKKCVGMISNKSHAPICVL